MAALEKFLEWFHDGREDEYDKILKVFGTTRRFLQAVIKYGEQDQIDIAYIPHKEWKNDNELFDFIAENGILDSNDIDYDNLEDEVKNYYLLWLLGKDASVGLNFICNNLLTDVEIRNDGYWLRLRDRDELAEFFKSSSRRSDYDVQEIAKQVLGDGLDYEYFSDTTYDVYSDVIEELNEKNIQHLANYILKNIGNNDLNISDYNSDFFEELAQIQARDGMFQITQDNVMSLIKDKEAMEELMDGDLSDLKGELYSIHSNAYNSSYENTIYDQVMEGLKEYFSSPIDDVATKVGEKTKYTSYIKIDDFYGNVMTFIEENLGSGYSDSVLDYHGSYTGMMLQLFNEGTYDAIDFRIDDYPDHREVDQAINDYFGDYI
jgi:hypothetical protein